MTAKKKPIRSKPAPKPSPQPPIKYGKSTVRYPVEEEGFHHLPPDEYNREDSKENR